MINLKALSLSLALCSLALVAPAQPAFNTFSSSAAAASTQVIIPADISGKIRITGSISSSDSTSGLLTLATAARALTVTVQNTNTAATNLIVSSTNGLSTNCFLIYQDTPFTTNFVLQVYGFANGTNLVTTAPVNFQQDPNDQVFILSSTNQLFTGKGTNISFQGQAIYVAPKGRPILVRQTGTSWSSLDSLGVFYDY